MMINILRVQFFFVSYCMTLMLSYPKAIMCATYGRMIFSIIIFKKKSNIFKSKFPLCSLFTLHTKQFISQKDHRYKVQLVIDKTVSVVFFILDQTPNQIRHQIYFLTKFQRPNYLQTQPLCFGFRPANKYIDFNNIY